MSVTLYKFHNDSGTPMDAHFEVQEGKLILHSRGGTKDTTNAQNTKYGEALRILLERIDQSDLTLVGVWVDSSRVQNLPMEERKILLPEDTQVSPSELFTRFSNRMAAVGRDPNNRNNRGNSTKRLRFAFTGNPPGERIARIAGWGETGAASNRRKRLRAAELQPVSAEHIWRAVQRLLFGSGEHSFGESTDYDVITEDGSRLAPKAVFGLAVSEALGFEVLPYHFVGGIGTPCFKAITAAGYRIVPKDGPVQPVEVPPNPDERDWIEGHPKYVIHLQRERGWGLAPAKKAAFISEHGRLLCERCGLDPAEVYGIDIGDACIDVHHKLPLADMPPGHNTQLQDLMCLCANCHRIIHRELRNANR